MGPPRLARRATEKEKKKTKIRKITIANVT